MEERVFPDRELELKILRHLKDRFAAIVSSNDFRSWPEGSEAVSREVVYLLGHGLVEAKLTTFGDGQRAWAGVSITSAGIDFLADDGGLKAILGVVTVKLHDDTIRQLLLAKVDALDEPATVKEHMKETIRSLPAESLKHTTMELIQAGLQQIPNALPHLMRLLQAGG